MSVEHEYPRMNIHVFMDIILQFLSMLLLISILISIGLYGCMDLLWILHPGRMEHVSDTCRQPSKINIAKFEASGTTQK